MSRLSHLERTVLGYHGQPAHIVAKVTRLSIEQVIEVRSDLRSRGHVPALPGLEQHPDEEQLSFDQVDHMMRANGAPREERAA